MKKLTTLFVFFICIITSSAAANSNNKEAFNKTAVDKLINDFHKAASKANEKEYFELMTDNAYFLGTDPNELWTKKEFREYTHPFFSKGKGWTYVPITRTITFSDNGKVAWFFERLKNKNFGEVRDSGVAVLTKQGWKIAQYNLTFTIPNDQAKEVVKIISKKSK